MPDRNQNPGDRSQQKGGERRQDQQRSPGRQQEQQGGQNRQQGERGRDEDRYRSDF